MRRVGTIALAVLLHVAGGAAAQPCGVKQPCCGELPPVRSCPLTIVSKPPPPPPEFCPTIPCPNIRLFRIEEKRPECCHAPPLPPIRVFTLPPPVAPVCRIEPPCVNWFRIHQPPSRCQDVPPDPPIRVTHCVQPAPTWHPTVVVPNIKVVAQPPPGGPLHVEACRAGCGSCGNGAPYLRGR